MFLPSSTKQTTSKTKPNQTTKTNQTKTKQKQTKQTQTEPNSKQTKPIKNNQTHIYGTILSPSLLTPHHPLQCSTSAIAQTAPRSQSLEVFKGQRRWCQGLHRWCHAFWKPLKGFFFLETSKKQGSFETPGCFFCKAYGF